MVIVRLGFSCSIVSNQTDVVVTFDFIYMALCYQPEPNFYKPRAVGQSLMLSPDVYIYIYSLIDQCNSSAYFDPDLGLSWLFSGEHGLLPPAHGVRDHHKTASLMNRLCHNIISLTICSQM